MGFDFTFSEVSPQIQALTDLCAKNSNIDPELYSKYDVKRGLRDITGAGVLAGLTEISEINSYEDKDGKHIPCEGKHY
jgi:citrate synthase